MQKFIHRYFVFVVITFQNTIATFYQKVVRQFDDVFLPDFELRFGAFWDDEMFPVFKSTQIRELNFLQLLLG